VFAEKRVVFVYVFVVDRISLSPSPFLSEHSLFFVARRPSIYRGSTYKNIPVLRASPLLFFVVTRACVRVFGNARTEGVKSEGLRREG
jgi:hypothetical protein